VIGAVQALALTYDTKECKDYNSTSSTSSSS
jgi:hypothetical protein